MDPKISLLKTRDSQFLKSLFEETNPYLFRILKSQKISKEVAEDLIQDSWRIFFEKIDAFEGRSQIKTFITGILINRLREHRRFSKKMIVEENLEDIFEKNFTPDGWWKKDPADPYRLLQSAEIFKFVEDCLDGLSEPQREAFTLKEIHQELTETVCNILNVTVTHLGVLIFRAKEKIRLCIEGKVEV